MPPELQNFLTTQGAGEVLILDFVFNLAAAAALSFVLAALYVRYGTALSNRRQFAHHFMLITMTTVLIISVVKSSLALSLGLVGALSIVRFRAAIKEPEELAYLFLAIAIGLGFGADQGVITVIAFAVIGTLIWLRGLRHRMEDPENLHLTVASHNPTKVELKDIMEVLKANCRGLSLKRFDETKDALDVSFVVSFEDGQQLERSRLALHRLSDEIRITFLDDKGVR